MRKPRSGYATMKIVCDACGQRYAISDDRVVGAGRVFKLTCKSCGHGMIVRGISPELADVSDEWFFAQKKERSGPVTREELAELVTQGTVKPKTYLWCRGMESWTRFRDVEGLSHLLEAAPRRDDDFDPSDTMLIPEDELRIQDLTEGPSVEDEEVPVLPSFDEISLTSARRFSSAWNNISRLFSNKRIHKPRLVTSALQAALLSARYQGYGIMHCY